jgi:hypothetical protein
MSVAHPEDREAAMSALHMEAGGLLRVFLFIPESALRLLAGAAAGDEWSLGMLGAIADCMHHITDAAARQPALCLTCPAPLRTLPGVTFCCVIPEVARPQHALGSAVCPACAVLPDLEKRAMLALRQIWPNLREISVMPAPEAVQ